MITPNNEDMKLADAIGAQCVRFPGHGDSGGYDLIQAARFIAMYREELTAKPATAEARVAKLQTALKPFADLAEHFIDHSDETGLQLNASPQGWEHCKVEDVRRAKAALAEVVCSTCGERLIYGFRPGRFVCPVCLETGNFTTHNRTPTHHEPTS